VSAASDDQLWDELRAPTPASDARVALIVTALIERFSRTTDVESGDRLLSWVESNASDFRPDLHGLFGVFSRLRNDSVSPTVESTFIGWQVAWLVSRGGVIPLLIGLDAQLNSSDRDERSTRSRSSVRGRVRRQPVCAVVRHRAWGWIPSTRGRACRREPNCSTNPRCRRRLRSTRMCSSRSTARPESSPSGGTRCSRSRIARIRSKVRPGK
jgi:hypothetical protein